jgi:hypothetical protein
MPQRLVAGADQRTSVPGSAKTVILSGCAAIVGQERELMNNNVTARVYHPEIEIFFTLIACSQNLVIFILFYSPFLLVYAFRPASSVPGREETLGMELSPILELLNKAYSLYLTRDHHSTFLLLSYFSITNLSQLNPMMRNWREAGQAT